AVAVRWALDTTRLAARAAVAGGAVEESGSVQSRRGVGRDAVPRSESVKNAVARAVGLDREHHAVARRPAGARRSVEVARAVHDRRREGPGAVRAVEAVEHRKSRPVGPQPEHRARSVTAAVVGRAADAAP